MPGEYFSGKSAYLAIQDSGSPGSPVVPALLSSLFDVTSVETNPTTDRFVVKPFRAQRPVSKAGFTTEEWTIVGPTTKEAIDFFEPMSNLPAGLAREYVWGPYGNATGQLQFTGTLDVLDFIPHGTVNADGIPEFRCTVNILTKTAGTF